MKLISTKALLGCFFPPFILPPQNTLESVTSKISALLHLRAMTIILALCYQAANRNTWC